MDFISTQLGALVSAASITVMDVTVRDSGGYALTAEITGREGVFVLGCYGSRLEAEDAREKMRRALGGRLIDAPEQLATLRPLPPQRLRRGIDALIPPPPDAA